MAAVDEDVHERAPEGGLRVTRLLGGFPAVAAIAAGVLYAVGALLKAAELSHAGLSVRDTLPLIPLQQLLARGMALVFDNLVGILYWGTLFLIAYQFLGAHDSRLRATITDLRRRNAETAAAVTGKGGIADELDAIKAEAAAILDTAHGEPDDEVPAEVMDRATALEERLDALNQRVDTAIADRKKLDEDIGKLDAPSRGRISGFIDRIPAPIAILALLASVLVETPTFAVGIAVPLLVGAIPAVRRRVRFFPHFVLFSFTWLVIAALAGAAISPPPLPTVQLTTSNGQTVSGTLIATTDSTWYVATGWHTFVSVDALRVSTDRITSHGHRRARLIYQYLF